MESSLGNLLGGFGLFRAIQSQSLGEVSVRFGEEINQVLIEAGSSFTQSSDIQSSQRNNSIK